MTLEFRIVPTDHPDASMLMEELCARLTRIVGHDGTMFLNLADFAQKRACFVVGYLDGDPICCAGLKKLEPNIGEVRRVYARRNNVGAARKLMAWLEDKARSFEYGTLRLECRKTNPHAIDFYRQVGYSVCPSYGPYVTQPDAVCMEKKI